MDYVLGIVLYLVAASFFIAVGKFTKECDRQMRNQIIGGGK